MWMRIKRKKQTDAGTIVLHWALAVTLVFSTLTGLRFAVDMPDTGYLAALEPFLPVAKIWIYHILSGVSVMGLAIAYLFYLRGTGLSRRIWPDRARLAALKSPGPARWGAINVLLYWVLFFCLAAQVVTGLMLHRGYGGEIVDLHLLATWVIVGYTVAHVLAHFALGGMTQLLRVARPSRIPSPVADSSASYSQAPFHKPSAFAGARILALSGIAGMLVGGAYLYVDRMSRDVLYIGRIDKATAADLNTDLWNGVWSDARPLYVHTNQGVNLDGTGASLVEIRAVHDDENVYFAFTWEDPTRSLKHAPLVKAADGWHALFSAPRNERQAVIQNVSAKTEYSNDEQSNFEGALNEDKFAIMLANVERPFGPGAFHPGKHPLPSKPASFSGRGQHYTEDGSSVNLWLWHADGADSGRCENNRVGPPAKPTLSQLRGETLYKGGYFGTRAQDVVYENFTPQSPRENAAVVQPVRLPINLQAIRAAIGQVDLDPNHGDQENARWAMREDESTPYTPELDARIPVGAIVPGIIAAAPRPPLPWDVQCHARWAAGRWTLLAERKLDTHHGDDIAISRKTFMWVGVFDHTAANHTRHIRPFRLEIHS